MLEFAADAPYLEAALVNRNNCTGSPSPTCGQFTDTPRHFRWNQFAGFAQDDWKVSPRLTVNLGLRYDVFESPTETNGILSNITLGRAVTSFSRWPSATRRPRSKLWNTDKKNFAPRIGVSWDPTGERATWCASGFSIAYNEPYSNLYTNASRLNPPDAITTYVDPSDSYASARFLRNLFSLCAESRVRWPDPAKRGDRTRSDVAITPSGVYPNLYTYSMQWFFGIQRQIMHDYALSINYVGTRGVGGTRGKTTTGSTETSATNLVTNCDLVTNHLNRAGASSPTSAMRATRPTTV